MKSKTKVIAYIFRKNQTELLVFTHDSFPEAGVQVVGGTVENQEDLKSALKREIKEESGLDFEDSEMESLGKTTFQRGDVAEINLRNYFRVNSIGLPETWSHTVLSDGADNGLVFTFFWLSVSEAKKRLVGNFGELLP